MKTNKLATLDNYLISLIFHLSLLLLLLLITFDVPKQANELMVEWLTDTPQEIIQENFAPKGDVVSQENVPQQNDTPIQETIQNPIAETVSSQTTVARGIEPPVRRPNGRTNSAPVPGTSSSYISGVKTRIQGSSQGGNGYQLDNDDGNIVILKQVLPTSSINDYGKVTLEFKIKRDGTVDAESILPVLIDNPGYTNASIVALKQWLFSYKSSYSSKAYRISFIFKPE